MNGPHREYLAIITARGGSKRLKDKNILPLAGKPLITHTIDAALDCGRFATVMVSSDSDAILDVAARAGAMTIKRPAHLAADMSTSEDAVRHALETVTGNDTHPHAADFVLLQPTSPLRTATHIAEAIDIYERDGLKSLASVTACHHPPQKTLIRTAEGEVRPLTTWEDLSKPRQILPDAYQTNGAIYISDIAAFLATHNFFTQPFGIYEMLPEYSLDIDDAGDFHLAEQTILAGRA